MVPPLEPFHQKIDLIKSADNCEQHLIRLRQHAHGRRKHYTSGTKHSILENVIQRLDGNIMLLKTWTAAISEGRQTSEESITTSIDKLFENIILREHDARKALNRRLRHGFLGFHKSKETEFGHLRDALEEISRTIGDFTICNAGDAENDEYLQGDHQPDVRGERHSTRFGTYGPLWERFPAKLDLTNNVGNPDDPGDGKVYDQESIRKVENILKAFYRAWNEATIATNNVTPTSPNTIRNVGKMAKMARICLTLRGMKQERLLDRFCESSKNDMHLPLNSEILEIIFGPDDADHAVTFCAEQYRAISRTWNDGEHIKVANIEPLPLVFMKKYGQGSYGNVCQYKHTFTDVFYACKEQVSVAARAHLLREIARLKKLGHRHIVQFVKSYQRGEHYGLLLKPAATTNLKKLLDRYDRNGICYDRDSQFSRKDRAVYRPIFLTAFGCLARGLAHIHNCKIRHKDIKPSNILYERALDAAHPARFLWADFGLAHDFSNAGNSKTVSNRKRYSPRYAAPEIMEEHEACKARGENHRETSDDDAEDAPEYATGNLQSSQANSGGHGRSSDIYSLGIVFLEILSYLVVEESKFRPNNFDDYDAFWKNLGGLQSWANEQIKRLPPTNPLVFLFKLGLKMIKYEATARPVVAEVVNELQNANRGYFCTACLNNPEEPVSQAVIAEEQMIEGLDNAKRLSGNPHHVTSRGHGSVEEAEDIDQSADEIEESPPLQPRWVSLNRDGMDTLVKRSSMRSSAGHSKRRQSVLRFDDAAEFIPDVPVNEVPPPMNDKENQMPLINPEVL